MWLSVEQKKFANYLEFYASLVPKFVLNSNHSLEIYEGLSENVKARLACRTDTWTMGPLIKKATNLSLQTTKGGVDINFQVRNLRKDFCFFKINLQQRFQIVSTLLKHSLEKYEAICILLHARFFFWALTIFTQQIILGYSLNLLSSLQTSYCCKHAIYQQ